MFVTSQLVDSHLLGAQIHNNFSVKYYVNSKVW